jgi:hypothetical protein
MTLPAYPTERRAQLRARAALLVLVVVVVIGGMKVPVVLVVDVVAVRDGLMPAVWPMSVPVARVGEVRQRMLVVVLGMLGVGVALMDVVDVTLALYAGMPAAGSVVVIVRGVNLVPGGGHGSSLL